MDVTWVLDSGSYLISSKQHLLILMQLGSYTGDDGITYTPVGSVPSSYLLSSFKQTVDIDLDFESNAYPIGRLTGTSFDGTYDGGSFSISNFTSNNGAVHGLFGWIGGATLKDIRLEGNWTVTGNSNTADNSAALVARINGTGNVIERVVIDGIVTCVGSTDSYGTICAKIQGDVNITDVVVTGVVNGSAVDYCGGLIGHIDSGTIVAKNIRYVGTGDLEYTRPSGSGLNGANAVGGLIGTIDSVSIVTVENAVNSMTGNLIGINCGGIIGMSLITNVSNAIFTNLVNGMTGDVMALGAGGGIFGRTEIGTSSYLLNVMKGNIETGSRAGGISGLIFTGTATNCIVAMNGNISGSSASTSSISTIELSSGEVTIEWATSDFGLTLEGSSITDILTKPVAASPWAYHADFPEIPYLEMSTLDSESNISYVATPFPNISGNLSLYDGEFDFFTVGFDTVYSPVETRLDPVNVYSLFKYDTVGFNAIESQGGSITFVADPYTSLFAEIFSHFVSISWFSESGPFEVSSTETGSSEVIQVKTSDVSAQFDISPNTEYVFTVYEKNGLVVGSLGPVFSPSAGGSSTTDMITFLESDLSSLDTETIDGFLQFIGESLDTTDQISANVFTDVSSKNKKILTFVDDSDTININDVENVLTPFAEGGTSTNIVLELSDNTTETVTFNDATNTITIDGVEYAPGDTLILDGKKVQVGSLK